MPDMSSLRKILSKEYMIIARDTFHPLPRWTFASPNQPLLKIISTNETVYANLLRQFLDYKDKFRDIRRDFDPLNPLEPYWVNGYIPSLDAVSLYCFLALNNPQRYLEVGSGNSTKFARRAICDNQLHTKIISIDPQPRVEIDQICDEVIRQPVENVDLSLFGKLDAGDILFIDNSHRVFANSDVTALFLDVLPILKPGVIVELHDIWLPYEYPKECYDGFFSEQYMLGAYLLGGKGDIEILLPNKYINRNENLHGILSPVWNDPEQEGCNTNGSSFWMRM